MNSILGGLYEVIVSAAILVIGSALIAVWNFFAKKTKTLKNLTIDLQTSCDIRNAMQDLIRKAEEFKNWTGKEKKEWVLNQLRKLALDKQVTVDEETISSEIDDAVEFTNTVNTVETKKKTIITNEQETILRDKITQQAKDRTQVIAVPTGRGDVADIQDRFSVDNKQATELQADSAGDEKPSNDDKADADDNKSFSSDDGDSNWQRDIVNDEAPETATDEPVVEKKKERRGERYV